MPTSKAKLKANLAAARAARRCQHTKLNGQGCAAPAMNGRDFCLFHSANYGYMPQQTVPEDASSIQIELTRVISLLQDKQIDTKSASLILYALQIASMNLHRLGAELPSPPAADDDLVADLYRRLDPLPEHAAIAWLRIKDLVTQTHRPYDPDTDDGRLDRPLAEPQEPSPTDK